MTAQVPDYCELDGVEYAIAGVSGTGLFEPDEHGIRPFMISTGCWRGFVATYAVVAEAFVLKRLRLGTGSEVDGVRIEPGMPVLGTTVTLEGGEYALVPGAWPVPFTGTLLLGTDFVPETYVHMGFSPAWRYARVAELAVDAGRVTGTRDRSAEMAAIREQVLTKDQPDPDGDRSNVGSWIARTFGLGYERTFGKPPRPPTP